MKKIDVKSVLIGILMVLVVMLLGSWKFNNLGTAYPHAIACNDEGNVVYVSNSYQVMVSKDFGETWELVHEKNNNY